MKTSTSDTDNFKGVYILKLRMNEEYLLSLDVLQDWNNSEEDEVWASLQ